MKKKLVLFVFCVISPLLPILAMLVLNKIGYAMALIIICAALVVLLVWAIKTLIMIKEHSPFMKILGTIIGIFGMLGTLMIGFISWMAYTKI